MEFWVWNSGSTHLLAFCATSRLQEIGGYRSLFVSKCLMSLKYIMIDGILWEASGSAGEAVGNRIKKPHRNS